MVFVGFTFIGSQALLTSSFRLANGPYRLFMDYLLHTPNGILLAMQKFYEAQYAIKNLKLTGT